MNVNLKSHPLITVTQAVEKVIRAGLESVQAQVNDSDVTFRVPENVDKQQVSVFLYDVYEDIDVRLGEAREIDGMTRAWKPTRMFLRFSYLITCWRRKASEGAEETMKPDEISDANPPSPAFQLPEIVLASLLRSRTLKDIPGAFCRVLPQSENLEALGQFWQALKGNNPRLCISYAVTVPVDVPYAHAQERAWPVVASRGVVALRQPAFMAWDAVQSAVQIGVKAVKEGIKNKTLSATAPASLAVLASEIPLGSAPVVFDFVALAAMLVDAKSPFVAAKRALEEMRFHALVEGRVEGAMPQSLGGAPSVTAVSGDQGAGRASGTTATAMSATMSSGRAAAQTWLSGAIAVLSKEMQEDAAKRAALDALNKTFLDTLTPSGANGSHWFNAMIASRFMGASASQPAPRAGSRRANTTLKSQQARLQGVPLLAAALLLASCEDRPQILSAAAFLAVWWEDGDL